MDISKYKALYLQEAREHLCGIEQALLTLDKNPAGEPSTVDDLFRHYHSIKGMSASMGYEPIMRLSHAQEELLDRVRSKRLSLCAGSIAALFFCLDGLKALINRVEDDIPLEVNIENFLERLKAAIEGRQQEKATAARQQPVEGLKLSNVMKVDGRVFDDLLATVGDLFMSLSSFKAMSYGYRSIEFKNGVHSFGKSLDRLHDSILSARMLPIKDLTEGLPRVIRDIARNSGKEVGLKIEGGDISLDRAILEGLGSPVVHIIRNAVDHGMETVEERKAAGKPASGTVAVKAYGKKDRVVIEISDDGRGMDPQRLRQKALARGMAPERVNAMTDREALMLACLPGLSTADKVTDTSGRGVGMDAVKEAVEGLGGALAIESAPGMGTSIIMELPRTTSILKALHVIVSGEVFLMPITKIEKVIEVSKDDMEGGALACDGERMPVVSLGRLLGLGDEADRDFYTVIALRASLPGEGSGERLLGIRVDDFGVEVDAYIKPLTPPFTRLWGVCGITVMGDGRPVFLLDIPQIASKALANS